jgi:hypothetical protein
MELNLEEALEAPVALSHRLEVPAGRLERPELLSLEPVEFAGILQKADPGFVLTGELSVAGQAICSRCLAPVPFSSRGEVSWVFAPTHRRPTEEETELTANDLEVVWYEDFARRGAAPAGNPPEAALPDRLQGALPALRDRQEHGAVRLPGRGRREAREAEVAPDLKRPGRRRRPEALPRDRHPER